MAKTDEKSSSELTKPTSSRKREAKEWSDLNPPLDRALIPPSPAPSEYDVFTSAQDQDLNSLFVDLVASVPFQLFVGRIKLPRFKALTRLIVYDIFTDESDEVKTEWLNRQRLVDGKLTPDHIARWRKSKVGKEILERMTDSIASVWKIQGFDEHIADRQAQDGLYRRIRQMALYGPAREAVRAQATLAERISPRARERQQSVLVVLPPEYAQNLLDTLGQMKEVPTAAIRPGPDTVEVHGREVGRDEDAGKDKPLLLPAGRTE